MSYHAEILADSISPNGVRLTTMLTVYPWMMHPEMLRHRVFSHSVASLRAIPTEVNIQKVREDPFTPDTYNQRVKGMGVGDEMDELNAGLSREAWLRGARCAAGVAEELNEIGLDKSRANRPLQPYLWVSDIITGTEWDNFFALRCHPAAQLEMQKIAYLMRDTMDVSLNHEARHLKTGEWHLPLVTDQERDEMPEDMLINVSAGRIARESYAKSLSFEPIPASIARATSLTGSGHFSPFEHQAKVPHWTETGMYGSMAPVSSEPPRGLKDVFWGNLRGFIQARKMIDNEDNFGKVPA